jgi:hypothetical protein
VKLKHDVLLYGAAPDHPEPLKTAPSDSLPEPLTPGYVEPALPFWTKLREWVELTGAALAKYRLADDTLTVCSARMNRYVSLLEDAARSELAGERLDDETRRFIAHIGDSVGQFTLLMTEPEIDRWDWAAGTDRDAAVVERTYRRSIAGCPLNGDLYSAAGSDGAIYAIAEIDGFLYLVKGAAFSYCEFTLPEGKIMTDGDRYEIVKKIR